MGFLTITTYWCLCFSSGPNPHKSRVETWVRQQSDILNNCSYDIIMDAPNHWNTRMGEPDNWPYDMKMEAHRQPATVANWSDDRRIEGQQPPRLAAYLKILYQNHLTSLQESRIACLGRFENALKNAVNQTINDPLFSKIHGKQRYHAELSRHVKEIESLKNTDLTKRNDYIDLTSDFIYHLLIVLRQYVPGTKGSAINYSLDTEMKGYLIQKLHLTEYIDSRLEQMANSAISFQDKDLQWLFEDSLDSLNTIRNHINLIAKCQISLREYCEKGSQLCSSSIAQAIYRTKPQDSTKAGKDGKLTKKNTKSVKPTSEDLKVRRDRLMTMNRIRSELRIGYMRMCNNALRAMSDGLVPDGARLINEECHKMERELDKMYFRYVQNQK